MTELNDFDSCTELISNLDGNGKKIPVIYNGEHYIMKTEQGQYIGSKLAMGKLLKCLV